jgi:hypothetical protein
VNLGRKLDGKKTSERTSVDRKKASARAPEEGGTRSEGRRVTSSERNVHANKRGERVTVEHRKCKEMAGSGQSAVTGERKSIPVRASWTSCTSKRADLKV